MSYARVKVNVIVTVRVKFSALVMYYMERHWYCWRTTTPTDNSTLFQYMTSTPDSSRWRFSCSLPILLRHNGVAYKLEFWLEINTTTLHWNWDQGMIAAALHDAFSTDCMHAENTNGLIRANNSDAEDHLAGGRAGRRAAWRACDDHPPGQDRRLYTRPIADAWRVGLMTMRFAQPPDTHSASSLYNFFLAPSLRVDGADRDQLGSACGPVTHRFPWRLAICLSFPRGPSLYCPLPLYGLYVTVTPHRRTMHVERFLPTLLRISTFALSNANWKRFSLPRFFRCFDFLAFLGALVVFRALTSL